MAKFTRPDETSPSGGDTLPPRQVWLPQYDYAVAPEVLAAELICRQMCAVFNHAEGLVTAQGLARTLAIKLGVPKEHQSLVRNILQCYLEETCAQVGDDLLDPETFTYAPEAIPAPVPVPKYFRPAQQPEGSMADLRAWGHPRYYEILEEMANLHEAKSRDYDGTSAPLSGFHEGEDFEVPAWLGVLIRMGDKWGRIKSLVGQGGSGQVKEETLADTLTDLAAYAIICRILREETFHHDET